MLQVSLGDSTVRLAATAAVNMCAMTMCFSPDSQRLLLPWTSEVSGSCLDAIPCPSGVPGLHVRLADCARDENFVCLADSVAITHPLGLHVVSFDGQQQHAVSWETPSPVSERPALLASNVKGTRLAALLFWTGRLVVYDAVGLAVLQSLPVHLPAVPHVDEPSIVVCALGQVLMGCSVCALGKELWDECLLLTEQDAGMHAELIHAESQPALSWTGRCLAFGCLDGFVRVYHAHSGALRWQQQLSAPAGPAGSCNGEQSQLAVGWTSELVLVAAKYDRRAAVPPLADYVHVVQW